MLEHVPKEIEAWHDFYVIVGTGAAALTGLLFVIVTLGPHVVGRQTQTGVRAFVSPVAAHFTYVLVISAAMTAPGIPLPVLGAALAAGGLGGIVFTAWTRAHQRWRAGSLPTPDWIWFVGMPYACFVLMAASGAFLALHGIAGLYGIGATSVLLVVTGIRNAWDLVLWVVHQPRPDESKRRKWKKT